jgi:hypothetical protein
MAQIPKPAPTYKVVIVESERGWGSKIVDELYFDNDPEAHAYVTDYNQKHNNSDTVPDWYMVAVYHGIVKLG